MTDTIKSRTVTGEVVRQVTTAAPAVRTLIVVATINEGGNHVDIMPVVLIRTERVDCYSRRASMTDAEWQARRWMYPMGFASGLDAVSAGWDFKETDIRYVPVVVDEGRVTQYEVNKDPACNQAASVVAAPWNPEEDEVELAYVIRYLLAEAAEKVAKSRPSVPIPTHIP